VSEERGEAGSSQTHAFVLTRTFFYLGMGSYCTFSHTSTAVALFSAVDVHLFPSKTNTRRTNGDLNWMRPPSTVTGALRVSPERS